METMQCHKFSLVSHGRFQLSSSLVAFEVFVWQCFFFSLDLFFSLFDPAKPAAYIQPTHSLLFLPLQILPALCVLMYHSDINVSI